MAERYRYSTQSQHGPGPSTVSAVRDTSIKGASAAEKTTRPPNAWIIYRSEKLLERKNAMIPGKKRIRQAELSRIIADQWRHESKETKAHYERIAVERKQEHEAKLALESQPQYGHERLLKLNARRAKPAAARPAVDYDDMCCKSVAPTLHIETSTVSQNHQPQLSTSEARIAAISPFMQSLYPPPRSRKRSHSSGASSPSGAGTPYSLAATSSSMTSACSSSSCAIAGNSIAVPVASSSSLSPVVSTAAVPLLVPPPTFDSRAFRPTLASLIDVTDFYSDLFATTPDLPSGVDEGMPEFFYYPAADAIAPAPTTPTLLDQVCGENAYISTPRVDSAAVWPEQFEMADFV